MISCPASHRISALAIAALLAAPSMVLAYSSPDQFLDTTNGDIVLQQPADLLPPPNLRQVDSRIVAQQKASEDRRNAEQQAAFAAQHPAPVAAATASAPSSVAAAKPSMLSNEYQYELRRTRMQQNGSPQVVIINGGANGLGGTQIVDQQGRTIYHSGASLMTASGPADALAAFAVLVAALATLGFALYREKNAVV